MYENCYQTISRFAPAVLPVFADRWSRLPVGPVANQICQELGLQLAFWFGRNKENADQIAAAIESIREHAATAK